MTVARNVWYLVLGALAAWAWHRIRQRAGDTAPYMVTATVSAPAALFPLGRVDGWAVTMEASVQGDDGNGGGVDPSTGLRFGDPDDSPEDEQ